MKVLWLIFVAITSSISFDTINLFDCEMDNNLNTRVRKFIAKIEESHNVKVIIIKARNTKSILSKIQINGSEGKTHDQFALALQSLMFYAATDKDDSLVIVIFTELKEIGIKKGDNIGFRIFPRGITKQYLNSIKEDDSEMDMFNRLFKEIDDQLTSNSFMNFFHHEYVFIWVFSCVCIICCVSVAFSYPICRESSRKMQLWKEIYSLNEESDYYLTYCFNCLGKNCELKLKCGHRYHKECFENDFCEACLEKEKLREETVN